MRMRSWQCSWFVLALSISPAISAVSQDVQPSYYEPASAEFAQAKIEPVQVQPPKPTIIQTPPGFEAPPSVQVPPAVIQAPADIIQAPPIPSQAPAYDLNYSCVDSPAPYCVSGSVCDLSCSAATSCNSSCGDWTSCCDCCCPLWTVRAGAIFLRRDNQDDFTLTDGATPIGLSSLAFDDYQPGPLVTVMRHNLFGTPSTLEVTYFGVQDSTTAASAGATTFLTTPAINFGARTVASGYRSRLDSGEINVRRDWSDWLTLLAGFRWVELSDELATDLVGSSHNVDVNNHLYGAQIGADAILLRYGLFSIESFIKAGLYNNSADQTTTTVGVGGAVPNFGVSDSRSAFLGELAVTGVYDLTDHWSIRGGYQALWFDGIALAPDQLAVSDVTTGVATLNNDANPIYHGFTVAAQCAW